MLRLFSSNLPSAVGWKLTGGIGDEVEESMLGRGRRSRVSDERSDFTSFSNEVGLFMGTPILHGRGLDF